jgi:hypothetical protein
MEEDMKEESPFKLHLDAVRNHTSDCTCIETGPTKWELCEEGNLLFLAETGSEKYL